MKWAQRVPRVECSSLFYAQDVNLLRHLYLCSNDPLRTYLHHLWLLLITTCNHLRYYNDWSSSNSCENNSVVSCQYTLTIHWSSLPTTVVSSTLSQSAGYRRRAMHWTVRMLHYDLSAIHLHAIGKDHISPCHLVVSSEWFSKLNNLPTKLLRIDTSHIDVEVGWYSKDGVAHVLVFTWGSLIKTAT